MRYSDGAVGRVTLFNLLLASLLGGGVAAAQQGLIVQPWHKPSAPPVAAVASNRSMPGSGLPVAGATSPAPRLVEPSVSAASPTPAADTTTWTPPVVTLLVDPWAKAGQLATVPQPRWVPIATEIIDPWATAAPTEPPRVAASRPAELPHETIF